MDLNSLSLLASSTTSQLHQLWSEIGLDGSEQQTEFQLLSIQIKDVYGSKINHTTSRKNEMCEHITQLHHSIRDITQQLQIAPFVIQDDFKISLKEQITLLSSKLDQLHTLKQHQMTKITTVLSTLHEIWIKLGYPVETGYESIGYDITDMKIHEMEQKIEQAQAVMTERLAIVELRMTEISGLLEELCMKQEELQLLDKWILNHDITSIGITDQSLSSLDARVTQLTQIRAEREIKVDRLAKEIHSLWNRLKVPESTRAAFLNKYQREGLALHTIEACEMELDKLRQQKQISLRGMIQQERIKLQALWDETHVAQEERMKFGPAFTDVYTDESLEAHEMMIQKMEARAVVMRPMLALVKRREEIKAEMIIFEKTCDDPTRFTKPGRLLQEEKFRRVIQKELPCIEMKLRKGIMIFQDLHGPFIIDGQDYLDTMNLEEEEKQRIMDERKARQAQEKAAKITPVSPVKQTPKSASKSLTRSSSKIHVGIPRERQPFNVLNSSNTNTMES